MELPVLVKQTAADRWSAELVVAEGEGVTREEALDKLRAVVEARMRGVEVVRLSVPTDEDADPPGTCGDEQSNNPAAIAAWLAEFNSIPPLQMTPKEEAAWQADRRARAVDDARRVDRLVAELNGASR